MNHRQGQKPTLTDLKYRPGKARLADDWQNILRCEAQHAAGETEYAHWLQQAVANEAAAPMLLLQTQPLLMEVEQALQQGCRKHTHVKTMWQPWLQQLYRAKPKPAPGLIPGLQSQDWLERFTSRHALATRGGEIVEPLCTFLRSVSGPAQDAAQRVLHNISLDTAARLAPVQSALLCPSCLARCGQHWIDLPWQRDTTFYGCRLCRQSREFFHHPNSVVVVLDSKRTDAYWLHQNQLHVNWFVWQSLFDFDQILITQADDEAVERFAVLVGNDTDAYRQPRYKNMDCVVAAQTTLSANTLRILQKTFGCIV